MNGLPCRGEAPTTSEIQAGGSAIGRPWGLARRHQHLRGLISVDRPRAEDPPYAGRRRLITAAPDAGGGSGAVRRCRRPDIGGAAMILALPA